MTEGRFIFGFSQPGERRPGIACPACNFSPFVGLQWTCAPDGCGGTFDTFASRARCPHCDAQFAWTACPACDKVSAHRAWYREYRDAGDEHSAPGANDA